MSIIKKPHLTYAKDAEGNWKYINEVANGLACNCYCPHCMSKLIAINSKPETSSKAHHFAHVNGSDCIGSDELNLHKLAEEVLSEEKKIMLPLVQGESEPKLLEFDSVAQESQDQNTNLRPDCVCYYGVHKLWVEFKRTHEVDTNKTNKIREAKIDCIEIDINKCEFNKESVRHFLLEESEDRIWVYNSKSNQTKTWDFRDSRKKAEYNEHNYAVIERHIAFDETAALINLFNINPNYNVSEHRYYCLNCGQELKIKEDHFEHIEENKNCTDDIYLLNAAKEAIYYSFNNQNNYIIQIPKIHFCEKINNCIFADKNQCYNFETENFDLKNIGYKMCEKSVRMPGQSEKYDIVFRKPISLQDAIIVNLSTEECDQVRKSALRQIDIFIISEKDVINLLDSLNDGKTINFSEDSQLMVKPEVIDRQINKFSLYPSGKAYLGKVSCTSMTIPRNRDVVQEFLFQDGQISGETLRLYSLLICCEKNFKGCYCELCKYCRHNPKYQSPICIRYKTCKTPLYPLQTKPSNCTFFDLNINLANKLKCDCNNCIMIDPNELNS